MKVINNTSALAVAFATFALATSDAKQNATERKSIISKVASPLFSEVVKLALTGKDARQTALVGSNSETIDSLMKAINPPLRAALSKVFEATQGERDIIAKACEGLLADEQSRSKSLHGALRAIMAPKPETLAQWYLDDATAISQGFSNAHEMRASQEAELAARAAQEAANEAAREASREPEVALVQAYRKEGLQGVMAWLASQEQAKAA